MKLTMLLLLLFSFATTCFTKTEDDEVESTTIPPPLPQGKSFFLFGAIFRKWRQRWMGAPDPYYNRPGPIYAGPAFPPAGYYNCPQYGCNPASTYRPVPYEVPNYYNQPYASNAQYSIQQPQQQLQPQQQQSNLVIYHNQQDQQGAVYQQPQLGSPILPVSATAPILPPLRQPIPAYGTNGVPVNYPAYSIGGNSYPPAVPPPPQPSYGNAFPSVQSPPPPPLPGAYVGPITPCGSPMYPCNVG